MFDKPMTWLENNLIYANMKIKAKKFISYTIMSCVVGIIIGFFILPIFFKHIAAESLTMIMFIASLVAPFGYLLFMVDFRKRGLEDSMSEALLLIASSLRAGTTLEWAITSSTRHRFGPIRDELEKTSKELILGARVEDALMNVTKRTPSNMIRTVVKLWIYGMRAGGNMADLLNSLAFETKSIQLLKQEIEAQASSIRMMLIIIVVLMAPMMLAMSSTYLIVTKSFSEVFKSSMKGMGSGQGSSFGSNNILAGLMDPRAGNSIVIDDVINFSYGVCIISSITVSALLGILSTGTMRSGIKYMPLFLAISVMVYYYGSHMAYDMLNDMFGGQLAYDADGRKTVNADIN